MLPPINQIDLAMRPSMSGTGNTRLIRQFATAQRSFPLPVKASWHVRFVGKPSKLQRSFQPGELDASVFAFPAPPCSAFVPVRLNWVYCTSVQGKSLQHKLCKFSHFGRLMLHFCSILPLASEDRCIARQQTLNKHICHLEKCVLFLLRQFLQCLFQLR